MLVHIWSVNTGRKLVRLGIRPAREITRARQAIGKFYAVPLARFRWGSAPKVPPGRTTRTPSGRLARHVRPWKVTRMLRLRCPGASPDMGGPACRRIPPCLPTAVARAVP
jgi:hypothetical protein